MHGGGLSRAGCKQAVTAPVSHGQDNAEAAKVTQKPQKKHLNFFCGFCVASALNLLDHARR
jgi:hypothetical protein